MVDILCAKERFDNVNVIPRLGRAQPIPQLTTPASTYS